MKINRKLALLILPAAMLVASCTDKEDKADATNPATPTTPTVLNVEQNKANMETSGIEMVNTVRDMKNTEAVKVAAHMVELMGKFSGTAKNSGAFKIMHSLKSFYQSGDVAGIYGDMRSVSSDPSSPQEAFDQIKGTHTWNGSGWDKKDGGELVFLFPSSKTATTNDASFTVTYLAYNGTTPFPNYEGDLPYKISATLKQNSNSLVAYNFESKYDEKGMPSLLNTSLEVLKYKMAISFNHNNSSLGINYSFKKDAQILFDAGGDAAGNFSYENIKSLADGDSKIEKAEEVTKLATKLNAHFQIMRYNIKGEVNLQGLANDIKAAGGSDALDNNNSKTIEILNKNYALKVYDTQNANAVVAGTEFYEAKETNTYTTQVWNSTTNTYDNVTKTETDEFVSLRLTFTDGSKSDLETYFNSGFKNLQNEVEKFATELEDGIN